jgi:hypothetical protein
MVSIVIDPGHGGQAVSGNSTPLGCRGPDGTLEKDMTLRLAQRVAHHLGQSGFDAEKTTGRVLNDFQKRVLISVGRWLKAETAPTPAARARTAAVVKSALGLFDRNLAVKTAAGTDPVLRRVPATFHASVDGDPEHGVACGQPFFTVDGPNCRRDVLTHELFHFLGVHHGGGSLTGATDRSLITTSAAALDSADNLAQLVSEIMNGRTDACVRPND